MNKSSNEKGLTYIEVILTMGIIMLAIIPFISSFSMNLVAYYKTQNYKVAMQRNTQLLEVITTKSYNDKAWLDNYSTFQQLLEAIHGKQNINLIYNFEDYNYHLVTMKFPNISTSANVVSASDLSITKILSTSNAQSSEIKTMLDNIQFSIEGLALVKSFGQTDLLMLLMEQKSENDEIIGEKVMQIATFF